MFSAVQRTKYLGPRQFIPKEEAAIGKGGVKNAQLKLKWFDNVFRGAVDRSGEGFHGGRYHVRIENVTREGFKYNAERNDPD